MVNVYNTYNPYTTVRDVDILVDFAAVNNDAAEYATFTATDYADITDYDNLTDGITEAPKYATCEDSLVMLDNSWTYLPDTITTEQIGWWSENVADDDGEFSSYPTLTSTLSRAESCVGFTLYSASKENAIKEAIVTAYSDNITIYSQRFYADEQIMAIDLPVSEFNKITVQVVKCMPNRRVKLTEFQFGINKTWDRNSIVSATIEEAADISGESLPIKKATIEFDNTTHEFDITGSSKKYANIRAMETATFTFSDINNLSKTQQLYDNVPTLSKYATSENSYTMLDGSYSYITNNSPNSYQIAYISSTVSDGTGSFSSSPTITCSWDYKLEVSGLRFLFEENNYPKSISVEAYENDTLIGSTSISDNDSYDVTFNFATYNCDKLVFAFDDMNHGNRFLKISEIQILKYADSWFNYLTQDYPLSIYFVINGEKVFMGNKYYFETVKTKNGSLTAEIVSHDYISRLGNQKYIHGANNNVYIDTFMEDIFDDTDITVDYYFDTRKQIRRTVPKDATKRNALQLGSQAVCGTCWLTRNDVFKINQLEVGEIKDTFDKNNLYNMDILNLSDYVTQVRLTVNNEYVSQQDPVIYTSGSGGHYREITNDCVTSTLGQSVADWILVQKKRRLFFKMECRGNPALEIGDTIKITDDVGTSYLAVIYEQKFEYDGRLKSTVLAIA